MNDDNPESPGAVLAPKHLSKQEFGRRLHRMLLDRGWRQSELARRAGIQRDSVSVYVRGRSFPTPLNLAKMADALGVSPQDLLPNQMETAIREDEPDFEMKVSPGDPAHAWIRVNRLVRMTTAIQIAALVDADAADRDRGRRTPAVLAVQDQAAAPGRGVAVFARAPGADR